MSGWKVNPHAPYHLVTFTIVEWQFVSTEIPYFQIIVDGLKYCIAHEGLHLHAFVIMHNHVQSILSVDERVHISNVMRDLNLYASRRITELLEEDRGWNSFHLDQDGGLLSAEVTVHPRQSSEERFCEECRAVAVFKCADLHEQ